jgi:tartrate-resistant acid phosphatase type 5
MLSFLVLGNWGRRGHRDQSAVAQGLAHAARDLNAQFVVTTGDNFRPSGVSGVLDPQFHDSFDAVYTDSALDLPWYASLGDCDHHGDVSAQAEYAEHDLRWRMPDQFYAINKRVDDRTHAQFVFLDSTPFSDDRERAAASDPYLQLYWLRNMLAPSRSDWKIIIGHHDLSTLRTQTDGGEAVAPVLHQFGAQVYLSGDSHRLQLSEQDGISQVMSGAGAGATPPSNGASSLFQRAEPGFASVTLDGLTMTTRFHNAAGEIIHEKTMETTRSHRQAA